MATHPGARRVGIGVHGGELTGIDTYAEQLAVAAARVAGEVVLLAATPAVAESLRARVPEGVRVVDLGLPAPTPRQRLLFRISPAAASHHLERALPSALARLGGRLDVLHLNHPPLAVAARGLADHVVVAGWFHPHAPLARVAESWRHTGGRSARSAAIAVKSLAHYRNDVRGYRAAGRVVTPTEILAASLRGQGIRAQRLVPPSSPPRRAADDAAASADGASDPRAPHLVVCCGDLGHPRKNVAAAVAAAGVLQARGRAPLLTLVGRNASALRPVIGTRFPGGRVDAVGPLPPGEVAARLRAADLMVLPSLFEEWGYVAVEAALQGTPVIALPVYPFGEMLTPPVGSTAAVRTPEALADAAEAALAAAIPRADVAAAAEERFGIATAGRALEQLWATIAH